MVRSRMRIIVNRESEDSGTVRAKFKGRTWFGEIAMPSLSRTRRSCELKSGGKFFSQFKGPIYGTLFKLAPQKSKVIEVFIDI